MPPRTYNEDVTGQLEAMVSASNVEVERFVWPPRLDGRLVGRLQTADWMVTDVGPSAADTGVAAYLHGQALPTLRLSWQPPQSEPAPTAPAFETSLYGAYDVGYVKDIVRWTSVDQLVPSFQKRLDRILQEGRRIGAVDEARAYFREAAMRKEAVFLSYSGEDEGRVAPVAAALRRRFQSVFDYRDGGDSIEPGRAWMDEIFAKLDRSAIAVLMLSPSYLSSGNCGHEARSVIAAHDAKKLTVVPVKLAREDLTLPPYLTDIQYIRAWEHPDANGIVDRIITVLD